MAVAILSSEPAPQLRTISVFGATGSIGRSAADVLARHRNEFRVEAVACDKNAVGLAEVAIRLGARVAVVADDTAYETLCSLLVGTGIEAHSGERAMIEAAQRPVDIMLAAIAGAAGVRPTLSAIGHARSIALANKECLVAAGPVFMRLARQKGTVILPVDSEHNAIFQALEGGRREDVARITLTASGGPFRTLTLEQLERVTPAQALQHPNWTMGPKVTIDSATLMNKGLELLEAHYLFSMAEDQLEAVVHPQSIVHGWVEWHDGSISATLGQPDMRIPIAHCLGWPQRIDSGAQRLDLLAVGQLSFEMADEKRFPCLALARQAMRQGRGAPTILNAANEVAVAAFLEERIGFTKICWLVETCLDKMQSAAPDDLESVLDLDQQVCAYARSVLSRV